MARGKNSTVGNKNDLLGLLFGVWVVGNKILLELNEGGR
jgi:hypothetical protein